MSSSLGRTALLPADSRGSPDDIVRNWSSLSSSGATGDSILSSQRRGLSGKDRVSANGKKKKDHAKSLSGFRGTLLQPSLTCLI